MIILMLIQKVLIQHGYVYLVIERVSIFIQFQIKEEKVN